MNPPEFTQQDAIRQRDVLMKMLSQIGEALGRQHWSGGPAGFSAGDVITRLMPQEVPMMSKPTEVEAALVNKRRERGVPDEIKAAIDTALDEYDRADPGCDDMDVAREMVYSAIAGARQYDTERITELEGALFGAGLLYGFECPDGLPCWCEPEFRTGPHVDRCAKLRSALVREAPRP